MKKLLSWSTAVSILIPAVMAADPVPPAPAAKPAAVAKPAPAPVAKPAPAPVAKPAPAPVAKPAPAPVAKPAPAPVAKPAPAPVAKTAPAPAAKPAPAPVAKPAPAPAAKPAPAPVAKPAPEVKEAEVVKAPEPAPDPETDVAGLREPAADPASTVNDPVPEAAKPAPVRKKYRRSEPIRYLIITANYATPRFLADRARKVADCTVVVVPENLRTPARDTLLTVIPANQHDTFTLRAEHLSRFLAYIRPINVIFLGNSDVVPPCYRKAVPSYCNVINAGDAAWKVNAVTLDNVLNTSKTIYRSYTRYNYQRKLEADRKAKEEQERAAAESAVAEQKEEPAAE